MSKHTRSKNPSRQAPTRQHKSAGKERRAGEGKGKDSKSTRTKVRWQSMPESGEWEDWATHLASRRQPLELTSLLPHAASHPLKWALPDEFEASEAAELVKQLTRLVSGRKFAAAQITSQLAQWRTRALSRELDSLLAWQALAWCHALPRLVQILCEADWRDLLAQLQELVMAAAGMSVHDDPVAHQMLNGELPLTLAYTFPEFSEVPAAGPASDSRVVVRSGGAIGRRGLAQRAAHRPAEDLARQLDTLLLAECGRRLEVF